MADDPLFQNNMGGYSQSNAYGFKPQPINDNNPMANYLQSQENQLSGGGVKNTQSGQGAYGQGVQAFAPVMQYLTALTQGDQASMNQATMPQQNQIKDSFSAIRNMISAQPRGGGKAGVLAEAPYKEQQQIGDMQSTARMGAAGSLGNVANSLAGLGMQESQFGLSQTNLGLQSALTQRQQNEEETAANKKLAGDLGQAVGGIFAAKFGA